MFKKVMCGLGITAAISAVAGTVVYVIRHNKNRILCDTPEYEEDEDEFSCDEDGLFDEDDPAVVAKA